MMRSEQDRRRDMGWRQQHSPESGDEGFEGQYEQDSWRPEWRRQPAQRNQGFRGSQPPAGGGDGEYPLGAQNRGDPERRSGRRHPPGPKGYQRSDERLREDVSERLTEARYIDSSEVTVAVSDAKVVLEGTVPERRMKHAIEDLVDACPGVQDIESRIRVMRPWQR